MCGFVEQNQVNWAGEQVRERGHLVARELLETTKRVRGFRVHVTEPESTTYLLFVAEQMKVFRFYLMII